MKALTWLLLGLILVTQLGACWVCRHDQGGDLNQYLGLAEGLFHGRYSSWWFLEDYLPDTFRNPGYPLFLAALGGNIPLLQAVQFGLAAAACALVLAVLRRERPESQNLFLLCVLLTPQFGVYAAEVVPEILMTFLVALFFYLGTRPAPPVVGLALLSGAIFQARPVFFIYPFLFAWRWPRRQALAYLGLFLLTTLPYGLWNYRHHGVFKLTSLEGGGGAAHLAFWAPKLPGCRENRYWEMYLGEEVIQFVPPEAVPENLRQFNAEWDGIDRESAASFTPIDVQYRPVMAGNIPTWSAQYTLKREGLLWSHTLAHIRAEPGFYALTRLYTGLRLWVTGVQLGELRKVHSWRGWAAQLYPPLSTGAILAAFLVSLGLALTQPRTLSATSWLALSLIVYWTLIQLPFVIQSRYTIPVRMLMFAFLSLNLTAPRPPGTPTE